MKTQNSPLNFLNRAKDKLVDEDADWNEYTYENKVRIAGDLLEALRKVAQQKEETDRQNISLLMTSQHISMAAKSRRI